MATTTAATAAASGLCARGKQASGEQCACKNHHRSSFHDILHLDGRVLRHFALSNTGVSQRVDADVAIDWRCECSAVFSTKLFVLVCWSFESSDQ
jgi:hypothetical protein